MAGNLESLLRRIRDDVASSEEVDAARVLVAQDARLPEELRAVALSDEAELASDAAGLLSVLGVDDLGALLAEAVRAEAENVPMQALDDGWEEVAAVLREGLIAEAGEVEVAEAVLRRLAIAGWAWGPVLAEAVRVEAGTVDVTASVASALDLGASPNVADAVRTEAGAVDISNGLFAELGLEPAIPVAEAVRAEAGTVDVSRAVLATLELETLPVAEAVRAEAGTIDVADAVLALIERPAEEAVPPSSVAAPIIERAPANDSRGYSWAGVALAAAALVSVVVGAFSMNGTTEPVQQMLFAQSGEVVVEDLSYGEDVTVFQTEGGQGAVILWLDEEA